jgi:hypothetical protein
MSLIVILMSFFNYIMGLIDSLSFYPLTLYFPMEMYIAQTNVKKWIRKMELHIVP